MAVLAHLHGISDHSVAVALNVNRSTVRRAENIPRRYIRSLCSEEKSHRKVDDSELKAQYSVSFTNHRLIMASIVPDGSWQICAEFLQDRQAGLRGCRQNNYQGSRVQMAQGPHRIDVERSRLRRETFQDSVDPLRA